MAMRKEVMITKYHTIVMAKETTPLKSTVHQMNLFYQSALKDVRPYLESNYKVR